MNKITKAILNNLDSSDIIDYCLDNFYSEIQESVLENEGSNLNDMRNDLD